MAENNTITTADGLVHDVYGEDLDSLVAADHLVTQDYKFSNKKFKSYKFNVPVSPAGGWTFAGEDSDVPTLNDPVAPDNIEASLKPSLFGMRQVLGYDLFTRINTIRSKKGREAAFADSVGPLFEQMSDSGMNAREISAIHGQSTLGLGVILGTVVSGSGTTTQVWALSPATFTPALLYAIVNMPITIYDTTLVTARNAATAYISKVDIVNKQITIVGTAAELDDIVATDVIVPYGFYANSMQGIISIAPNTGSLYGINAATYTAWAGNTLSLASTRLSRAKVGQAVMVAISRGLKRKEMNLYANPQSIEDFQESMSNQVVLKNGEKELKSGIETISYAIQGVKVNLRPHIYWMPGYADLIPAEGMRVGPQDLTFRRPGQPNSYFRDLENDMGVQLRCYFNHALLLKAPHCAVHMTNVVDSTNG